MSGMRVLHVVGARPQFVKLAPVSAAVRRRGHRERILHTGQHFDDAMSRVFFRELDIGEPHIDLGVHSLTHGAMTGRMLEGIERVLLDERPDVVLVYGDTDSTLAATLAAVKLGVPCAHVEAGLRSFNRAMPEELNRVAADHLADLLLAPTENAMKHLAREGLGARARLVGDVMYDAVLLFGKRADETHVVERLELAPGEFLLATLHRPATTDDVQTLGAVLDALDQIARSVLPVVLPLHPRTRRAAGRHGVATAAVRILEPVSYLEMLGLLRGCRAVLTDSGGLQKEAYFANKVCFTLRSETEWVETVEAGANVVCGLAPAAILAAVEGLGALEAKARFGLEFYGRGDAAEHVVASLSPFAKPSRRAGA